MAPETPLSPASRTLFEQYTNDSGSSTSSAANSGARPLTSSPAVSSPTFDSDEARWKAVLARDIAADGSFVYLVRTTKIYCRPTCPSRRPLRQNVSFEDAPTFAIQRGYKACRRCLPDSAVSASQHRQSRAVDDAQAVLMTAVLGDCHVPKLDDLAAQVGMSKYYFQRVFKKSTGMSPAEYARSLRTGKLGF